jgi:HK97 family phage portal protein
MVTRKKKRRRKRGGLPEIVPRSIENPNVPLNVLDPDEDTFAAFGAERSASGVRVTPKKALGYPAVWRAVNLIAGDIAKLPLLVYRQQGKNKEVDTRHPAYRLLKRKPNPLHTPFVFKQVLMGHALTRGNGYAYIDRNGPKPQSLLILCPDKVEPVRVDGSLWYVYGQGSDFESYRKLPAEDVIHIRGLGFDGIRGYNVLDVLRESLGAAIAARDFSARYFRNSGRPGGALKHPGKLSPQARTNMRESWERIHRGLDNSHKVAILEEGTEFVPFASNARDAQLLESREFDAREIANIFGVPTHKLGDPSKVAYNSLEQENQSYYDDTISRWLRLFSEEASDKLLSESEKESESHVIDFDYQELQRANLGALTTFVSNMVDRGIISDNEGRSLFGLNAREGGDEFKTKKTAPPCGRPNQECPA